MGAPLIRAIVDAHPDWKVTAYTRGSQHPEELKHDLGVDRVEVGDFTEFEKIKALCKEHDIAVNAGNSFTDSPISAIVAGLRARPSESKGKLLHISGQTTHRRLLLALSTLRVNKTAPVVVAVVAKGFRRSC